jgi:hypothetical protein
MSENKNRIKLKELSYKDRKPIPLLEDPDEPFQSKPHVSTWWITLNSNKEARNEFNRMTISNQLVTVLKALFEEPENLVTFLNFNQKFYPGHTLTSEMLQDPVLFPDLPGKPNTNQKLSYVREVGGKKNRVHLHAKYRIIHYSNLTINYEDLHEKARQILSGMSDSKFDSVYAHVDFVPSSLPLYNYMMKGNLLKKADRKKISTKEELEEDFEEALKMLQNTTI